MCITDIEGVVEKADQPTCNTGGLRLVGDLFDHQRELVATEPREQYQPSDENGGAPGEGDQHLVADGVAEDVVDRLEAIEIDHHQRNAARIRTRCHAALPATVLELPTVWQAVQRVSESQMLGVVLGALTRLDLPPLVLHAPDTEDHEADETEHADDHDFVEAEILVGALYHKGPRRGCDPSSTRRPAETLPR